MEETLAWWETVQLPPAPKSLVRVVAKEVASVRFERSNKTIIDALILLRDCGVPFEQVLEISKQIGSTLKI